MDRTDYVAFALMLAIIVPSAILIGDLMNFLWAGHAVVRLAACLCLGIVAGRYIGQVVAWALEETNDGTRR